MTARRPTLRIGEVWVCPACLRTQLDKAEIASGRCRCGGTITAMPKGEIEARRADRHGPRG